MKKLYAWSCILLILASAMPSSVLGLTEVSGTISSGTWTSAGNPYRLLDHAVLPVDSTLTIEEGVIVKADAEKSITFYGTCQMIGTKEKPIKFTSQIDGEDWGSIRFWQNVNPNYMLWTIVEHGNTFGDQLFAGAVNVRDSNINMRNCTIRHNHARYDGGGLMFYRSTYLVDSCLFYDNHADRFGGAIDLAAGSEGTIKNSVLYNNGAIDGGAIYFYSGNNIADHLSFYNNFASSGSSVGRWYYSEDQITNSILWNSDIPSTYQLPWDNCAIFSCLSDNTIFGEGVIHQNPLWIDPDNGDFRLSDDSPCIDAGNPESPADPDGSRTDLGAYWVGTNFFQGQIQLSVRRGLAFVGIPGKFEIDVDVLPREPILTLAGSIRLPNALVDEVLSIEVVEGGPADHENWEVYWIQNGNNLAFSAAGSSSLQNTGALFQVVFTTLNNAPINEYPIQWQYTSANEGGVDAYTLDGSVQYTDLPPGDVSMNGNVQSYDPQLILQWYQGITILDDIQLMLGDVSGNGETSLYDASLIYQYLNGVIEEFPVVTGETPPRGTGNPFFSLASETDEGYSISVWQEQVSEVGSVEFDIVFDRDRLALVNTVHDDEIAQHVFQATDTSITFGFVSDHLLEGNQPLSTLFFREQEISGDSVHFRLCNYRYNESPVLDLDTTLVMETLPVTEMRIPAGYELLTAYPNPFNPTLHIKIGVEQKSHTKVEIIDLLGRHVATLVDREMSSGLHQVQWNATGLASGVYYIRAKTSHESTVRKVVYLQ